MSRWCALLLCASLGAAPMALANEEDASLGAARDAAALAGPPGVEPVSASVGPIPDSPPPLSKNPTFAEVLAVNASIEEWIAWGWRAGGVAATYSLAGDDARSAVERAAREVLAASTASMRASDALIAAADQDAKSDDDEALSVALLARRVSVPLRAARGAIWAAACRDPNDPGVARLLGEAEVLASGVVSDHPGVAMERAALRAQVAILSGDLASARRRVAEGMRAAADLGAGAPKGAALELALARARAEWEPGNARVTSGILDGIVADATTDSGVRDFATVALCAGVRARIVLEEGLPSRSPAVRTRAASAAAEVIGRLVTETGTSETNIARRRAGAFEAYRGIAARMAPTDAWPGVVVAAVAERRMSDAPTDRSALIDWLDQWIESPQGAIDPNVDEVSLQLARALAESRDPTSASRAASLAAEFAESHSNDDRSGAALGLACASAAIARTNGVMSEDRFRALLIRMDEWPAPVPDRDRWRVVLAQANARAAQTIDPSRAIELCDQTTRIAKSIADAQLRRTGGQAACEAVRNLGYRYEVDPESLSNDGVDADALVDAAWRAVGILESDGPDVYARGTIGMVLVRCGRFEQALDALDQVAHAADPGVWIPRVEATAMLGDRDAAVRLLDECPCGSLGCCQSPYRGVASRAWREVEPHADALPESGSKAFDAPRYARALLAAETVIPDSDPDSPTTRRHAGIAASLAGMNDDAKRLLAPIHESDPGDALVSVALADALIGLGDDAQAFAILRGVGSAGDTARRYDRNYVRAWVRMLQILDRQNTDGSRTDAISREAFRLSRLPDAAKWSDLGAVLESLRAKYPADTP